MATAADALYRLIRPALFRLDAETAHRVTLALLSAIPLRRAPVDPPELRTRVLGVEFSNPIGLAAGMDKDARAIGAWQRMGFGFAEIGTITPRPQPGNPRPRIWRLPAHRALVNSLGFPSDGMEAAAGRVVRARHNRVLNIRIGLNLGPNKETAVDDAAADYARLTGRLSALADFVVINVSSPNTPGLRNWQSPERIGEIMAAIKAAAPAEAPCPPVLVKLAPDLDEPTLWAVCDAAVELGVGGIVVSNTTLKREEAGVATGLAGGLSGAPLLPIARKLIGAVYRRAGGRLAIIGVGGVMSAEDAFGHLAAGASLVELYTGLVYEGPGLAARIKAGLVRLLAERGFRSISDVVGSAAAGA
jgi:dihydroorotate dehydrogenase